MVITNDQYLSLYKLEKWYNKYNHQIIEISGVIGTGIYNVIKEFINNIGFDRREVVFLSYDQKQVLEMASKGYHTYFIDRFIYKYHREVNLNSLYVINPNTTGFEAKWIQSVKKKIHPLYKIIIVLDSILLSESVLTDLSSFGLPIILLKDPMLIPDKDSYTFVRDSNIELHELHPDLLKNPITYFANKILIDDVLKVGSYDKVTILNRKQMNLYNLQFSDMTITMTENMRNNINKIYRHKILKLENIVNVVGEKLIVYKHDYREKLVNEDEKNIKLYLHKGMVGYISRCYKHRELTKYLNMDFQPDFYHESFEDLIMDRHFLNNIKYNSKQEVPDNINYFQYAYALTPYSARLSHWDNIIITTEMNDLEDIDFQRRLLYTAITRARKSAIIII